MSVLLASATLGPRNPFLLPVAKSEVLISKIADGATWADVIGNRTAWGVKATNYLKTAILISTPVYLTANQRLRLVVQNPFGITDESALHGENNTTSPPPTMTTSTKIPISKSLTMILLDYDLQ